MGAFLLKRLAFSLVTLLAVLSLVFVVVRIVPGDPAQVILGDQPLVGIEIEEPRESLGLLFRRVLVL